MSVYFKCDCCGYLQISSYEECAICEKSVSNSPKYVDFEEYEKLRAGIENWLKRMEYYSDNQYGKREMKKLIE